MPLRAQLRHREVPLVVPARVLPRQLERRARRAALVHAVAGERGLRRRAAHEAVLLAALRGQTRLVLRLVRRRGVRGRARLHAVDADDPVLRGERLLEVLQVDVLLLGESLKERESAYADHGAAVDVVARLLVVVETDLAEAVVGEAVEKRVAHGGRGVGVDSVLPGVEEVGLLDVVGIDARRDADHPEEFVDVVAAVADESAEDNEHVVHVEAAENRVGLLFGRGERLCVRKESNQEKYAANSGDVRVVPGVVVHDDGAVAHSGHLVAVVPPGHELGVLVGVHAHPVVRFAVIVEDRARAVAILRGCALEGGKEKPPMTMEGEEYASEEMKLQCIV